MTDEVLVYGTFVQADFLRAFLASACAATGVGARLELYGSGSLFERLGPRHAQPLPDAVFWYGPLAAHAAAQAGLLQPYQPPHVADGAVHEAQWRWTSLEFMTFAADGTPPVAGFADLAAVPRLALADPERSEAGMLLLLATLDRARQVEGDTERGWRWWQQRAQTGLALFEDEASARDALGPGGGPSHAVGLATSAPGLVGLAPVPNVISLAANARNVDAARRLLDWATGQQAAPSLRLSPWQASANGLQSAASGAPPLDVDWAMQQYNAARRRWAQSGFGPTG